MNTVIFLDVDGVLNTRNTIDRCCGYTGIEDSKVALLAELVSNLEAEIVLTSTWREEWDDEMGQYLRTKLDNYGLVISAMTPMISHRKRCLEVKEWLKTHKIDKMIILDDMDFGWSDHGLEKYWVETDWYNNGLTADIVDGIIDNKENFNYG